MTISKQEYQEALKIVNAFEEQEKQKKLSIYNDCSINDIIVNKCKYFHKNAVAFWVTKEKELPERNPDSMIIDSDIGFFTIEGGTKTYDNYEEAYKALIKKFKRLGLIK